jgi:type III pantothenate kinase
MFLALDVGNTHTVLGVLDEEKLFFSCRFSTDRNKTSDEYSVMIRELLIMHHTPPEQISGGIISCYYISTINQQRRLPWIINALHHLNLSCPQKSFTAAAY